LLIQKIVNKKIYSKFDFVLILSFYDLGIPESFSTNIWFTMGSQWVHNVLQKEEDIQCVNFIAIITPNVEKDKNVSQQEEVMDCVKVVAIKTLIKK